VVLVRALTFYVETIEEDNIDTGWKTLPVLKANGKEIWRGKENIHYRSTPEDQAVEMVINMLMELLNP